MNCKICGHRTQTINAMRIHYVKNHPQAMKRKKKEKSPRHQGIERAATRVGMKFCPSCGARL